MTTQTHPNGSKPAPTTAPSLLDSVLANTVDQLEKTIKTVTDELDAVTSHFRRQILLATAADQIRSKLTDELLDLFCKLQDSPLGFKTDRGPGSKNKPYDRDVVRECLVQAFTMGAYASGNEFNILFGQCFLTLAYWKRRVEEIPGIAGPDGLPRPRMVVAPPVIDKGKATCLVCCDWTLNGKPGRLIGTNGQPGVTFPVVMNTQGPVDNAATGKASRQGYKAVYELIKGGYSSDPGEIEIPTTIAPRPAAAPPIDRNDILARIAKAETDFVEKRWCNAGDLYRHLAGCHDGEEVATWGDEWLASVKGLVESYGRRQSQVARDRDVTAIRDLMKRLGLQWQAVCQERDYAAGTTIEQLNTEQRGLLIALLNDQMALVRQSQGAS